MPIPATPGRARRQDYEYRRLGTCNVFMASEPLAGWRMTKVTARRTKTDWAHFLHDIAERYPDAKRITLVMDNLSTHRPGALYEGFSPAEAKDLWDRFEFVYTPKHGSWLNVAEVELSVLTRQCLSRRLDSIDVLRDEVAAWQASRDRTRAKVNWRFTTPDARIKLNGSIRHWMSDDTLVVRRRIPMSCRRTIIRLSAVLAVVALAKGCGDGDSPTTPPPQPDPPRPATVAVAPATVQLNALGATEQLTAEVRDQYGNAMAGATVSWASSAAAVATVDAAGLVTAIAGGAATITAMAAEASGTTEIMVIDLEWAADFVARQHVVDVMNVAVRVDPNCTADCRRRVYPGTHPGDLGGIKEVTGIDMSMTNPGSGSGRDYMERFSDGRVANVRVVRTYADIEVAREDGEFAIMWYLQTRPATGRWQLGREVATLRDWYDEGLRVLQIAYGSHREDARGPDERLGYGAGEGDENGVTDLGRFAISEMNQLGMIVDCSHCNRQTTLDAASMSTKPILANHANAKALTDDPYDRNKTDEELMAIAANGGVIGVTPIRLFLDTDGDGVTGMDDMIAHIEYIASLVGIDHVGIASDTYVDGEEQSSHHYASADLAALDRWVRLTARLRARGWSEEDLAKLLGGNFLRVFREVLRPQ